MYQTIDDVPKHLLDFLEDHGCFHFKIMDGKLCALEKHKDTVAISVGLTYEGRERRYIYKSLANAALSFYFYTNLTDEPEGYIIREGAKDWHLGNGKGLEKS